MTLRTVEGLTDDEWRVFRHARVNVLLVSCDGRAEQVVDALRSGFCEPIAVWHPASRQVLPPPGGAATLILQGVDGLPRDDQHALCEWLAVAAGRTRVVSTTRQPLFPLVEAGTFAKPLYYRLNTLCFVVSECDS